MNKMTDSATELQIKIRCFGITKDICGGSAVHVAIPQQSTVADLLEKLYATYPDLKTLVSLRVAVNESYAEPTNLVQPADEIALIPPVSGG